MKKSFVLTAAVLLSISLFAGNRLSRQDLEKLNITLTYPQWKLKALTFSYDDGNIADRKLVAIFNRYGMKATFHIPSNWLKDPKRSATRVKEAEINQLYAGHEVAGHGAKHVTLILVKPERIAREFDVDISEWQRITGKKLLGYAYPFGRYNDTAVSIAREKGLIYARTAKAAESFDLTDDFLRWRPHAHHKRKINKLGEEYLKFIPKRMSLLMIWGHSYEFEKADNWYQIENFCQLMANKPEIFYATMGEIAHYAMATTELTLSDDGKSIKNNSLRPVYFLYNDRKIELAPNAVFDLK